MEERVELFDVKVSVLLSFFVIEKINLQPTMIRDLPFLSIIEFVRN